MHDSEPARSSVAVGECARESPASFRSVLDPAWGAAGLGRVRDELHRWLQEQGGLREPALHEVLIAVGEACANAVEHSGARPGPTQPAAWVTCSSQADGIRIVIGDRGRWKRPCELAPERNPRGRGRLMMTALMDQVSIRTDAGGTVVEMFKKHA